MMMVSQEQLTLSLPTVYGPKDYREHRELLINADRILRDSGVENKAISDYFTSREQVPSTNKDIQRVSRALRCAILKTLSGLDYRELATRIADSELYKWFTGYNTLDCPNTPSKSTLERYMTQFSLKAIEEMVVTLNRTVSDAAMAALLLNKEEPVTFDMIYADGTCLKADIHFPVDWILLRDTVKSLIKAIIRIRKHGLLHRMRTPAKFISEINALCIQMSQARRKIDAAKCRKMILRKMKKLNKLVELHAIRYRDLLKDKWGETKLSEKHAYRIVENIDTILDKLPKAIKQAHERIIGGRSIKSADKILSLYDDNAHVIIRGKAGAEVEFGNGLYLAEQEDGLIADWELFEDQPPSETKIVPESIDRMTKRYGKLTSFTSDRGFSSAKNDVLLDEKRIYNGTCPKNPAKLKERSQEQHFIDLQKRRAQTEGRIGIFKNVFLGKPMRSRDIEKKKHLVNWAVLTHNLWVLARMAAEEAQKKELAKAA